MTELESTCMGKQSPRFRGFSDVRVVDAGRVVGGDVCVVDGDARVIGGEVCVVADVNVVVDVRAVADVRVASDSVRAIFVRIIGAVRDAEGGWSIEIASVLSTSEFSVSYFSLVDSIFLFF